MQYVRVPEIDHDRTGLWFETLTLTQTHSLAPLTLLLAQAVNADLLVAQSIIDAEDRHVYGGGFGTIYAVVRPDALPVTSAS